tara:strand:+ start:962 stop:2128 length:1167 start_codon:yes stop_codon:yes gene_type:complete
MDRITFVIPSRNNLEFLKLAVSSIRQLKGEHEILVLDDASVDGTGDWLESLTDRELIVHTNPGPERVGIVGMFDRGIEMATTDIIFAFHADMVAGSNLDVNILKHLKRGKVVCATRIEPPLHPEGPEKIIHNFGIESDEFNLIDWKNQNKGFESNGTTEGIFAPWCMYKDDYLAVGGHDELFAPQSREDSDLFNRFVLKGYELIQSWDGLVYHFTSRGSRFNKHVGGGVNINSEEWMNTNHKNMRNFTRKWGTMVRHNPHMKPIVAPKYDIGFVVENTDYGQLYELEPWCSTIYIDLPSELIDGYLENEQSKTTLNLGDRVKSVLMEPENDIVVRFDGRDLTPESFHTISQLPDIFKDSGEIGEMELGIFKITINKLGTYEKENIYNS